MDSFSVSFGELEGVTSKSIFYFYNALSTKIILIPKQYTYQKKGLANFPEIVARIISIRSNHFEIVSLNFPIDVTNMILLFMIGTYIRKT